MGLAITAGEIISRYLSGYYPYFDRRTGHFYWDQLPKRAIIPLNDDGARKAEAILARIRPAYTIERDRDFEQVLNKLSDDGYRNAASPSWVRGGVMDVYRILHDHGLINTIEAYRNGELVGGLLGIRLPGVFIAETMFGEDSGSSKACVMHMYRTYHELGYKFIDVQVAHAKDHPTARLGEQIISTDDYISRLREAITDLTGSRISRSHFYDDLLRFACDSLLAYGQRSPQWSAAQELLREEMTQDPGLLAWWRLTQRGYPERFRAIANYGVLDSRRHKPFPSSKESWRDAVVSTRDADDGTTLEICGFQVMQSWEAPLMHAMADSVAFEGATILEVGYGLGVCSQRIQTHSPRLHVIIEANRELATLAEEKFSNEVSVGRVKVICAFWQDLGLDAGWLNSLGLAYFDGIVFDTFPLSADELRRNHFPFLPVAFRWLTHDGRLTYFSDERASLTEAHQDEIADLLGRPLVHVRRIDVSPPQSCEYWHDNEILLVVLTKV